MFIKRWRRRFFEHRLEGLYGRHRGSRPTGSAQRLEARILLAADQPPASPALRQALQVVETSVDDYVAYARLRPAA